MATIKDIAEIAKVSPTTVSRVLNYDETMVVSAEVKKEIFRIAQELKYMPPKMRNARRKGITVKIGVADWHIVRKDRQDYSLIALSELAGSLNKDAEISFVRLKEDTSDKVDGIIAFGIFTEEEKRRLDELSKAIVFVNADNQDYAYDQIMMDYEKGLQDMVTYLLEQKQYRSIGYVGGIYKDSSVEIGRNRLRGLQSILKKRECYQDKFFLIGEITKESGRCMMEELLLQDDIPEVVILGNDEIAEGAMEVIHERNLRIPKDIAVVMYQDIDTRESKYSEFTCLKMLPDMVWITAVKMLLEQIMEHRLDTMKIFLPAKLVPGESA